MSAVRRILTWGLVAAVAALVVAAGIDALRGGEEPEPVAATEPGPSDGADGAVAEARAALQAACVPRGRLLYADGDCRNHTLLIFRRGRMVQEPTFSPRDRLRCPEARARRSR